MFFTVSKMFKFGLPDDSLCHAMREVLFQTGGNAQDLLTLVSFHRNDFGYLRTGICESAGLVKDNGIRTRECF